MARILPPHLVIYNINKINILLWNEQYHVCIDKLSHAFFEKNAGYLLKIYF